MEFGGDIILSQEWRDQDLSGLKGTLRSPFNIYISIDPANIYQQTFNPLTTMAITQAIVNVRRPKKVVVAGDASLWAKEHIRYIASVLAGNGIEVVYIHEPLPIGVGPGLLSQRPELGDMILDLNRGGGSAGKARPFGLQIYTPDGGALTPAEFAALYDKPGGIESFIDGRSDTIHLNPVPMAQQIPYQLPDINFSESKSVIMWFADVAMFRALNTTFVWANNRFEGTGWWHGLRFGITPEARHFEAFETPAYLTDGTPPFSEMLQHRPETTAILVNPNGSRVGLAEKVPQAIAGQLEPLGAIVVSAVDSLGYVIVHYPPFLIWTILAALYADEFVGQEKGKAFAGTFPSTQNVRRIAESRGITYLQTDVSEGYVAHAIKEFEAADPINRVLLFDESTGNGNTLLISRHIKRIERQTNAFAVATMLLYFNQKIKPAVASFGAYLIGIENKFGIHLYRYEQNDVREDANPKSVARLRDLKKGDALGTYQVERVDVYSEVSRGRRIVLTNGASISIYHSYKDKNALRIFIEGPDEHTIKAIKTAA